MSLPRRWLQRFLDEAFARDRSAGMGGHTPEQAAPGTPGANEFPKGPPGTPDFRTRTRARRLAAASMEHRGLMLGAPLLRREQLLSKGVGELVRIVRWLAVVADHVVLVGHALDEPSAPPAQIARTRATALATALALVYLDDEAAQLVASNAMPARTEKALAEIERELVRRRYLHGNPILGLLLNHAFIAADSRALVNAVVDVYGRAPPKGAAASIQAALRAERLATLASIARLSEWREAIAADLVRSASIWQVKSLGLPRADTAQLLEQTKKPADLSRLVTLVPHDARSRVFVHTVLAACIDGRVSPEERDLTKSLAAALGLPPPQARRVERRVQAFVRLHKAEIDPLTAAAGFAAAGPPISVRVARLVFENIDALWREIRETGDLAYLLARRASGQRLSASEQKRMRDQLIDVVKAVPSLAVFTLPGGFVLLPILLKLLPFDLRPSSFRATDERFRAFATGSDDALTADDLARSENEFLSTVRGSENV